MNEDTEARIALRVRIDLIIDLIDAPDEQGVVWIDTSPYDLGVVTEGKLPTTEPLDDGQWLMAVLIGVGVGTGLFVVILLWLAWPCYVALGVLLWLLVSSVS